MPRLLAANVLEDILYRKQTFEHSFPLQLHRRLLDTRDKSFAFHLILTTLRRLGQIDELIGRCLDRPLPRKAAGARTILRLGVAQLFFLDVPPHAAVNTSVDLANERKQGPYKKLINAVLRRLNREGKTLVGDQDSAKLNTVEWLWESWAAAFGHQICRRIAEAHLCQAPLDLTVKNNATTWTQNLSGQLLKTGSIRLFKYGDVETLFGYEEGAWWVQDTAAVLPVKLLGDIKGLRIADLCAAPGGKTAQLAAGGAEVIAIDRSANRLNRLKQNIDRLSLTVETVVADAISWRPKYLLDAVLIDAPCTATGTIRRHPDIQYLKNPGHVTSGLVVQKALLQAASEMVKPGGVILYATCSLQPEEGPSIIEEFIGSGAAVSRHPICASELAGMEEFLTSDGDLRTLPCFLAEHGGMDGFFAARLVHD
jgi:16S rRNA (cytosine967-C5)-methyltransferase